MISIARSMSLISIALSMSFASHSALAGLTAGEMARLRKDLTPVGAELAGNAAGTIPAWTGGLTKPPANFDRTKGYANPFAGEKPLFVITDKNVEQYKANLTEGQIAMLKKFPKSYRINVYPTHRTGAYSATFYDHVKKQAAGIALEGGGAGILNRGASRVPFPIPKAGIEPIWNHVMVSRGTPMVRRHLSGAAYPDGRISGTGIEETTVPAENVTPVDPKINYYNLIRFYYPSDVAGDFNLLHETVNQISTPRSAWQYAAGQRRLRRSPDIGYDSMIPAAAGTRVGDDYTMFVGDPFDRFDWKLLGKREIYIPYNSYDLTSTALKTTDIVKPEHFNPDLLRYELHRVWAVEATLKPGKRHVYAKKIVYFDEDTWLAVLKDNYDGRGNLWRTGEQYLVQYYDVPFANWAGGALYDLTAGSYWFEGLTNETKQIQWDVKVDRNYFDPDAARRMGTR